MNKLTSLFAAGTTTAALLLPLAGSAHADSPPPFTPYQGQSGSDYYARTLSCRADLHTNEGWHGDYVQGSWSLYSHTWYPDTGCMGYTIRSTDGRNWTRVSGFHDFGDWRENPWTYREWDGPGYLMESCVIEWHGNDFYQSMCTKPW